MPRRQLDIIKDLFIAQRDKNNGAFINHAEEYVAYLRCKNFEHKAHEFEILVNQIKQNLSVSEILNTSGNSFTNRNLFGDEIVKKEYSKKEKSQYVWQISRGAQIDFTQASVILEYCIESNKSHFSSNEYPAIIGYSPEKSEGFSRILYFLGLLDDKTKNPSMLARLILLNDKYFEDLGTLWFLHYYISSDRRLIIWNRISNHLIPKPSFTYEDVIRLLDDQRQNHSVQSFGMHLRKEFSTCIKAYIESNFSKLNLLSFDETGYKYHKTQPYLVPDEILLAAIWLFKTRYYPNEVALEIKLITTVENSPGRLFYLTERYFRDALERLRIKGYITIESFADLDQIKFTEFIDYLEVLRMYFKQKFE